MSIKNEFKAFLFRGNIVDLAVGIVIGGAFGKIVSAFVEDLVMPIVSAVLPAGGWRAFVIEPLPKMQFKIGNFLGVAIDFLVIAAVLFIVLIKVAGKFKKAEVAPAAAPATKVCQDCMETVPAAAKRCKFCTSSLSVAAVVLAMVFGLGGVAHAQDPNPEFKFAKTEEKPAEKKLQARGGLLNTAGNARSTTATVGARSSYQKGANRVSAEGNIVYAQASSLVAQDGNGNSLIDSDSELGRDSRTTSEMYSAKARFDRFLTLNNSAYGSLQALKDEPAGKAIVAGGQVGYSRQLLKNETHRMVAEIGYDFAFEKATADGAEGVPVHSARIFIAEELKLTESTGAFLNFELLTNLNEEKAPATGYGKVDSLADTRVLGKAGITTTLWKNLSFAFTVGMRYDNAPAPLKEPKGAKFWNGDPTTTMDTALQMRPAYRPLVEKLDTLTEATLVVTFL